MLSKLIILIIFIKGALILLALWLSIVFNEYLLHVNGVFSQLLMVLSKENFKSLQNWSIDFSIFFAKSSAVSFLVVSPTCTLGLACGQVKGSSVSFF